MRNNRKFTTHGQSMVIIALMLVALIAILALTIDGGFTFVQRRRAQNAADAGALAGARLRCSSETVVTDEMVIAEAREFAGRNGIDDLNNVQVLVPPVVSSVYGVEVTVTIPYNTFFAGVLGIADTQVSAVAEAACYPPCAGSGVLPIAWSCSPPAESSGSDYCEIEYAPNGIDCDRSLGDPMYIIVDSADFSESILCQEPPPPVGESPGSGFVDCDLNDDGINEVILLSGADRSWLNLNGDEASAAELMDWIENGFHEFPLEEHMWFNGSTGVVTAAYNDIRTFLVDKTVFIPVFDTYCPVLPGDPDICTWHAGEDIIKSTNAGTKDYFHIFSFAMFHVTCVDSGNVKCDVNKALKLPPQLKTVEGCFVKGIVDDGSGAPGECTADVGAYILKLIR